MQTLNKELNITSVKMHLLRNHPTTLAQRCCDPLTYFPQFNRALKLLTSHDEQDGQVDAGVQSWLQLEALPVPGDEMGQGGLGLRGFSALCSLKKVNQRVMTKRRLTTVLRCPCFWCLCSLSRGRCPYRFFHKGRTCLVPDVHMTAEPAASL